MIYLFFFQILFFFALITPYSFVHTVSTPSSSSSLEPKEKGLLHYYAGFVARAVESGFKEANNLYNNIEPELYKKDVVLRGNHPSVYLAAINRQSPQAKELAKVAYATLKATSYLKEQLSQFRDGRDEPVSNISLNNTRLQESNCPSRRQADECNAVGANRFYRSYDGTCNNLDNYHWGSAYQPFSRFLPPDFEDGISTIRKAVSGKELPSARFISTSVHKDKSRPSSTITLMLMQWGQFLDHDLTATSQTRSFNHSIPKCCHVDPESIHPDCLPIPIPKNDPYFNDTDCMEFIRSSPSPRLSCSFGPREQLNQVTSYLDASAIYGSSDKETQSLRLLKKGHLKYSYMPSRKSLLPPLAHPHEGECQVSSPRLFCFNAGDGRVNEQPGLAAMHTIWLRQHNFIADNLASVNQHWDEETLFQETRKIVSAQIQHITYREFLPLVVGSSFMKVFGLRLLKSGFYREYNDSVDSTVPNVFATAAFRFGHSLVQPKINRCDESHREMPYKIDLSLEMMSPSNLHNLGEVDRISLGLAMQRAQKRDEFITTQLTNHLFKTQGHKGLDLAAINIQRGRDHGIPPYIKWREACGLLKPLKHGGPVETWEDFSEATSFTPERTKLFSDIYESPLDIDLFPGGMIEYPVKGGLVGPTFACIISQTFRNLRRGDRFWYENEGQFTEGQLKAIRNTTLARVICDTSDAIRNIQPIIFMAIHLQQNPHVECQDRQGIPHFDFQAWKQHHEMDKVVDSIFANLDDDEPNVFPYAEIADNSAEITDDFIPETPEKLRILTEYNNI